jgi:hypothetical protein
MKEIKKGGDGSRGLVDMNMQAKAPPAAVEEENWVSDGHIAARVRPLG